MPYRKVGPDDYVSPSGKHINAAQNRLWHAGGGKWPGEKRSEEPKKFASGGPTMPMGRVNARGVGRGAMVAPPRATPAVPASPGMGPATPAVPASPAVPQRGTVTRPPMYAAGGPVLGRSRDFLKTADEFTGGRMPTKQSAPVRQDYAGGKPKGADKSEKAVTPRK